MRLEKGEKGTNLSAEDNVSKQQISDIRKNKEKIMKFADILETSEGLKRKSLKFAHDEQLDKALYAWFIQQRTSGTPTSGPLLQEKAKHFYSHLHTDPADGDLKASTGWLEKFKNRHGIRNLSIQAENLSAAEETVEPFLRKLRQVMEEKGLTAEQIYNADETGSCGNVCLTEPCWHAVKNLLLASRNQKNA